MLLAQEPSVLQLGGCVLILLGLVSVAVAARAATYGVNVAKPLAGADETSGVHARTRSTLADALRVRYARRRPLTDERRRECQAPSAPRVNASRSCRRFGRPSQNSIASGTSRKPPQCGGRGTVVRVRGVELGQPRLEPLAVRDRLALP